MRRISLIAATALTLTVLVALSILAPTAYPFHTGSSKDFWLAAAGVDITHAYDGSKGVAIHHGGRWVYAIEGYEGQSFYQIDDASVLKDLPLVEAEITSRISHPLSTDDWYRPVYTRWKSLPAPQNTDLNVLFLSIDNEWERINGAAGRPHFVLEFRNDLLVAARKADFYWCTFLLEFAFFAALIWFACWPFIRNHSVPRKILHLTLIPILFYLPLWLSYASFTQLRNSGPQGGILYPRLIIDQPLVSFDWDTPFLASIPPILAPITQGPVFTNHDLTGFHTPLQLHGPADVLVRTVIFLSPYLTILLVRRLRRQRNHQGFPVIPLQSE